MHFGAIFGQGMLKGIHLLSLWLSLVVVVAAAFVATVVAVFVALYVFCIVSVVVTRLLL